MEASILDLRRRMADILRALDRNETVKILYRGKLRAFLVPAGQEGVRRPVSSLEGFGIWKDHEGLQDVDEYVRRLRRGRFHAD